MSIQPIYQKAFFNSKQKSLTEHVKVDVKTEIDSEQVKRILSVSSTSSVTGARIENGLVEYKGKAIFYICYEDQEGNLKKHETSSEFEGKIEATDFADTKVICFSEVEKTEADVSGIKLCVFGVVSLTFNVKEVKEVSYLSSGEGVVCDTEPFEYYKSLGKVESFYPIEDEFELPYAVEEILYHKEGVIVTACQCGVGSIIVDGEIKLCAIILKKTENSDIIKEEKTIPYRIEIECGEAMPSNTATASALIKSFKTDITVDENLQKSIISAVVNLAVFGEAYLEEKTEVVKDAFSLVEEVRLEKEKLSCCDYLEVRSLMCSTSAEVPLFVENQNANVKAVVCDKSEIISYTLKNDKLSVNLALNLIAFYSIEDQKFYTKKVVVPISVETACNGLKENEIDLKIYSVILGHSLNGGNLSLNVGLHFSVYPCTARETYLVKEIMASGEKKCPDTAISVYLGLNGESLFGLSKRLNAIPSELLEQNPELTFPLSGKERIIIYRQK
jgi:hypothetical protein